MAQVLACAALRVDTSAVGEHKHKVVNKIVFDLIIRRVVGLSGELDLVGPASPADRDSRIGQLVKFVMYDSRVARITHNDGNAAAILRPHVAEEIVGDVV